MSNFEAFVKNFLRGQCIFISTVSNVIRANGGLIHRMSIFSTLHQVWYSPTSMCGRWCWRMNPFF